MQSRTRILEDLAKVTTGAASTLAGIKNEIAAVVRQQLERLLADMEMVPREEFDAVKAMAAKARSEQEALQRRVDALEAQLKTKKPRRAAAATRPAAKKG